MSKETTKTILLEAGRRIFLEKGYTNSGIETILQAAGVPKGSFYYYFASKEDFGLQVLDRFAGEIAANVTGVAQAAQDTSSGASSAQSAAQDLARLAEELSLTVSRFVVEGSARLRRMPAARGTEVDGGSGFAPSLAGVGRGATGGNGTGTA